LRTARSRAGLPRVTRVMARPSSPIIQSGAALLLLLLLGAPAVSSAAKKSTREAKRLELEEEEQVRTEPTVSVRAPLASAGGGGSPEAGSRAASSFHLKPPQPPAHGCLSLSETTHLSYTWNLLVTFVVWDTATRQQLWYGTSTERTNQLRRPTLALTHTRHVPYVIYAILAEKRDSSFMAFIIKKVVVNLQHFNHRVSASAQGRTLVHFRAQLECLRHTSLKSEFTMSTSGTHSRVNLGDMGDKVSLSSAEMGKASSS